MAIATNITVHLRLVLCSCGIFSLVHFYQGLGRLLKVLVWWAVMIARESFKD